MQISILEICWCHLRKCECIETSNKYVFSGNLVYTFMYVSLSEASRFENINDDLQDLYWDTQYTVYKSLILITVISKNRLQLVIVLSGRLL